jgi:hypothetical protein
MKYKLDWDKLQLRTQKGEGLFVSFACEQGSLK